MALPTVGTALAANFEVEQTIEIKRQLELRELPSDELAESFARQQSCYLTVGSKIKVKEINGADISVDVVAEGCNPPKYTVGYVSESRLSAQLNAIVPASELSERDIPVIFNTEAPAAKVDIVFKWDSNIRSSGGLPACRVKKGTRVEIRSSGNYPEVRVLEGPNKGCTGKVAHVAIEEVQSSVQKVFTAGRWGDDAVPVFKDRNSFFDARERKKMNNAVCKLKVGSVVNFIPFRDWGLGEVKTPKCSGWIDRGVIR